MMRKNAVVIGCAAGLLALGACAAPSEDEGTSPGQETEVSTDDSEKAADKESPEEEITKGQENALRAAENYLEFSAFSKAGLIDQLTSEYGDGYDKADAKWAVNQLDVDWNEQAVRAAEQYLETSPFSRDGMIDQLSSEYGSQFTKKQAIYAADELDL